MDIVNLFATIDTVFGYHYSVKVVPTNYMFSNLPNSLTSIIKSSVKMSRTVDSIILLATPAPEDLPAALLAVLLQE